MEIGLTRYNRQEIDRIVARMGLKYTGKKYHLLLRNCNHFADEFVLKLTGKHIPLWINRLAHMAVSVRWLIPVCLLPDVSTITLYVHFATLPPSLLFRCETLRDQGECERSGQMTEKEARVSELTGRLVCCVVPLCVRFPQLQRDVPARGEAVLAAGHPSLVRESPWRKQKLRLS